MRTFGLIGYPLTHSFSQTYFAEKFRLQNIIDASYHLFPLLTINEFPDLLKKNPSLQGLNVTIPYKETVIPYLDELDETAKSVGAVNTIRISSGNARAKSDFFLKGFNTDVYGFRQSIKPFLESQHERALILGTGGASKAVAYVLREMGIDCYFVSRKSTNKNAVKPGNNYFEYEEINEYVMKHFLFIINTTPVGMYPDINNAPEIPYQFITKKHFFYDLIYNPEETRFLLEGKKRGALTLNGLCMLQQQAEKAWEIFRHS